MIHTVKAEIEGIAPISFSRFYQIEKIGKETHEEYRERTWREYLHYDPESEEVFIPPMMLNNCVRNSAQFLGKKVPGRGAKTYAQFFRSGVLVQNPMMLGVKKEDAARDDLFLPADGKPGSGSRVPKTYPRIDKWKGNAEFIILDDTITQKVFTEHLEHAGTFIGFGRFRPERGGYYGRFKVNTVAWA